MGSLFVEEKCIGYYSSRDRILLVGEGDFSFALSLATAFGDASNMVATSLDSEGMLEVKYMSSARANVALLKLKGCTILHEVDALTMSQHPNLRHRVFDRIAYNFPHAGFVGREDNSYQISLHKEVVGGFLRNGRNMLTEKGEIHVTHKTEYPYSEWEIVKLGQDAGLKLTGIESFNVHAYPGYVNRRGAGNRSYETFRVGTSCTYKQWRSLKVLAGGAGIFLIKFGFYVRVKNTVRVESNNNNAKVSVRLIEKKTFFLK
ncbi:hypothetical protein CASFOL_014132 [Castilleja foliolosa]|uniref:25S rRNA (uridine-N(3))-methyltransferase BMT5-like domain-containing protein n=1 Tax=Castilleja foliolosa TaxID=1961234 RepID=A0ABD3DML6_9LAMI